MLTLPICRFCVLAMAGLLAAAPLAGKARAEEPPADLIKFAHSLESAMSQGDLAFVSRRMDLRELRRRFSGTLAESSEIKKAIDTFMVRFETDTAFYGFLGPGEYHWLHARQEAGFWRLAFRGCSRTDGQMIFFDWIVHPGEFWPWEIADYHNYMTGPLAGGDMFKSLAGMFGDGLPEVLKNSDQSTKIMAALQQIQSAARSSRPKDWESAREEWDKLPEEVRKLPALQMLSKMLDIRSGTDVTETGTQEAKNALANKPLEDFQNCMRSRDWTHAAEVVKLLREWTGDDPAIGWFDAEIALGQGDEVKGKALLREVLQKTPEFMSAWVSLWKMNLADAERTSLKEAFAKRFGDDSAQLLLQAPKSAGELLAASGPLDGDMMNLLGDMLPVKGQKKEFSALGCAFTAWPDEGWETHVNPAVPQTGGTVAVATRSRPKTTLEFSIQPTRPDSRLDDSAVGLMGQYEMRESFRKAQQEILKESATQLGGKPARQYRLRQNDGFRTMYMNRWVVVHESRVLLVTVTSDQEALLDKETRLSAFATSLVFLDEAADKSMTPAVVAKRFAAHGIVAPGWPSGEGWQTQEVSAEFRANLPAKSSMALTTTRAKDGLSISLAVSANEDGPYITTGMAGAISMQGMRQALESDGGVWLGDKRAKIAGRVCIDVRFKYDNQARSHSRHIVIPGVEHTINLMIHGSAAEPLLDAEIEALLSSFAWAEDAPEGTTQEEADPIAEALTAMRPLGLEIAALPNGWVAQILELKVAKEEVDENIEFFMIISHPLLDLRCMLTINDAEEVDEDTYKPPVSALTMSILRSSLQRDGSKLLSDSFRKLGAHHGLELIMKNEETQFTRLLQVPSKGKLVQMAFA
ncbi:MAG: hypothetical protein NTY98_03140, partial [Verrucomicrobia bacterium]|nr:hypothetical protein [Verrucomicrobiota bacterium]